MCDIKTDDFCENLWYTFQFEEYMNKGIVLIAIHLQVKCTYVLDETPSDVGLKVVY